MRLLRIETDGSLSLADVGDDVPGRYAILSHTWGPDSEEPNFVDLTNNSGESKAGYSKITFCQKQAAADNIRYFWVDTCCIDKSGSAELTEALNSMFRWYRDAHKCYVYLSDVSTGQNATSNPDCRAALRQSRWFTRGWTLQELLAPISVEFFSMEGVWLGSKESLQQEIHQITGIPLRALLGAPLSHFSIDERMSWASKRQTKREEDAAYSLLGIFDVFMPPIYGERRRNAFLRLENEIHRSSNNLTHSNKNGEGLTPLSLYCHRVQPILAGRSNASSVTYDVPFNWKHVSSVNEFVGRQDEIAQIHQCFVGHRARKIVTLHGLGGIGKTQLALAYIQKYQREFSAIFWFNCSSVDTLKQGFGEGAKRIHAYHPHSRTADSDDLDTSVMLALKWFSQPENTRWLIVLDNHDSPKLPGCDDPLSFDVRPFLPDGNHGSILITTRSSAWKMGSSIALEKLPNNEQAIQILSSASGQQELSKDPCAHKLCDKLDGLPLALATAGTYLSQVSTSIADYIQLYDKSWYRLQQASPRLLSYEDKTLFSTWNISLDHIRRQSISAENLLKLWAFFDNNDIWFELLKSGRDYGPEWFRELCQDRISFDKTIRILLDHGLIEADSFPSTKHGESAGYNMHCCVHSWVLNVVNQNTDNKLARLAIACVGSSSPGDENSKILILQRRLLPHAMRIQQDGHYKILEMTHSRRNDIVNLQCLGGILGAQAKLDEAEAVLSYALTNLMLASGTLKQVVPFIYNSLGSIHDKKGSFAKAKEMVALAVASARDIGNTEVYMKCMVTLDWPVMTQKRLSKRCSLPWSTAKTFIQHGT